MRKIVAATGLMVLTLGLSACDGTSTEPVEIITTGSTAGIHFSAGSQTYAADGALSATTSGGVLAHEFAVARADSLGGIVAVGYDADGLSGNLMIIQAPDATGTYTCGTGSSCHGRYITRVPTNGDTSGADRFFEITSGSLTITSVSGGRLTGSFNGTLTASDARPDSTMTVTGGTIDVMFLADGATDGSLSCLLSKVGIGGGSCQ